MELLNSKKIGKQGIKLILLRSVAISLHEFREFLKQEKNMTRQTRYTIPVKMKSLADQKYFRHLDMWARWKARWKTNYSFMCLQFSGSNANNKNVIEKEQLS